MIAIVGGSGLYDLPGLEVTRRAAVETPYGAPSDEITIGHLAGKEVAFLPRHGRGHRILPHEINFRANIWALKSIGVSRLVSFSAVGSMREDVAPGDLVVVEQFIDRTWGRPSSFFGDGVGGHIAFADPTCRVLRGALTQAAAAAAADQAATGVRVHVGGTYVVINGPAFSTRAESFLHRAWGVDVVGMTNLPEARLAREAEICYATLALSTDYDAWHETEAAVDVTQVLAVMKRNGALARDVAARVVALAPEEERTCPCATAGRSALITDPAHIPEDARRRLPFLFPSG